VIRGPARALTSGQQGVKVIGPDGKEIKGARVIIGADAGQTGEAPVVRSYVGTPATTEKKVELKIVGQDGKTRAIEVPAGVQVPTPAVNKVGQPAIYSAWTSAAGGNAITLSRATYKLNKDQATALGTLLGSIKATVMETKVDGDNLTVTTTPEAQQTIGQIVRLITGQGSGTGNTFRYEWKGGTPAQGSFFVPAAPAAPAVPGTPARPAAPSKPAPAAKPTPAKPTTAESPEKPSVRVILDQLKPVTGIDVDSDIDMAKLQELLKSLKPKTTKPAGEKP
jgi:hypothetical protein